MSRIAATILVGSLIDKPAPAANRIKRPANSPTTSFCETRAATQPKHRLGELIAAAVGERGHSHGCQRHDDDQSQD
jgi:hypothetical protein